MKGQTAHQSRNAPNLAAILRYVAISTATKASQGTTPTTAAAMSPQIMPAATATADNSVTSHCAAETMPDLMKGPLGSHREVKSYRSLSSDQTLDEESPHSVRRIVSGLRTTRVLRPVGDLVYEQVVVAVMQIDGFGIAFVLKECITAKSKIVSVAAIGITAKGPPRPNGLRQACRQIRDTSATSSLISL